MIGIFNIWLCVRGAMIIPRSRIIGSAILLDEPVVLPENEGKVIVIQGKVQMVKPAYDEELGITLNTIHAYRYDEEYIYIGKKDDEDTWDWSTTGTKAIVGEAVIGEFQLDEKILYCFPVAHDYSDFNRQETSGYAIGMSNDVQRTYLLDGANVYYSQSQHVRHGSERSGAVAHCYRFYDPRAYEEITSVVGIQKGNMLIALDTVGGVVKEGALSPAELMKSVIGNTFMGLAFYSAIGVGCIFLGLKKSKEGAGKKRCQKNRRGNK